MKFKNFGLLMAAALLVGFTSCNNGDEPSVNLSGETKTVMLKLDGGAPDSYALGDKIGATQITFSSGHLYFTDATGVIHAYYKLVSGTAAAGTNEISINEAATTNGKSITGIPVEAVSVYVVGNTTGVVTAVGGNISAVRDRVLNATTQSNVSTLNLYGTGPLVLKTGGDGKTYTCSVQLAPTVARIELEEIVNSALYVEAAGEVKEFTPAKYEVKGVFIDKYYPSLTVGGAVSGTLVSNGDGAAAYNDPADPLSMYAGLNGALCDWAGAWTTVDYKKDDAPQVPSSTKPDGGKVWGYNIPAAVGGSQVPRIIVRIVSQGTKDGPVDKVGFVTVQGFAAGGSPIESIMPGTIYKVSAVSFVSGFETEGDIIVPPVDPTPTTIDAEVSITQATWKVQSVAPIVQ